MPRKFDGNAIQKSDETEDDLLIESKKRSRATNFSTQEEDLLIKCVSRRSGVIESKRTDAHTVKEKQHAWDEITDEFNALCPNAARQSKALKDKYTNMKTALRKRFAAEKANGKATGGGKRMPDWEPESDAMAGLAKIISTFINATPPNYDAQQFKDIEYVTAENIEDVDISDENPLSVLPSISEQSSASRTPSTAAQTESWPKYTLAMLRKPKRPKSATSSCSEDSLLSLKRTLVEREIEMREEEHAARLAQQQAEHEARMAEHKARMSLLLAQKQNIETKIELRQLKIANYSRHQQSDDSDDTDI